MPIIIELEKDYFYQKGVEKGIEKDKTEVILRSFDDGISIPLIANIIDLPIDKVKAILQENKRL